MNGLAVVEGMVRRGTDPEWFGALYQNVASKMLECEERMGSYHILRFEEILERPRAAMTEIYRKVRLDLSEVKKVRFQVKGVMTAEGDRVLSGDYDRQVVWYDMEDMESHISPDIDRIQVDRLDPGAREKFLSTAGDMMERLGYV